MGLAIDERQAFVNMLAARIDEENQAWETLTEEWKRG
jgi:hypothetical protein